MNQHGMAWHGMPRPTTTATTEQAEQTSTDTPRPYLAPPPFQPRRERLNRSRGRRRGRRPLSSLSLTAAAAVAAAIVTTAAAAVMAVQAKTAVPCHGSHGLDEHLAQLGAGEGRGLRPVVRQPAPDGQLQQGCRRKLLRVAERTSHQQREEKRTARARAKAHQKQKWRGVTYDYVVGDHARRFSF